MNWKGRQMFGGRPSGIVQMMGGGMTPYPTHTMPNGTVMPGATHGAGYEAGGMIDAGRAGGILGGTAPDESSMEQRIAQIAAQQGKSKEPPPDKQAVWAQWQCQCSNPTPSYKCKQGE